MQSIRDRLLFILRGGEVQRYHTMNTLKHENVAAHSFGVALLCYLLYPEAPARVYIAALSHDLAEQRVGDIPAPAKRELRIGTDFASLEDRILSENGFLSSLSEVEKTVVKLADCFQGMLFCISERSLGNIGIATVYGRYRSYVLGMLGIDSRKAVMLDALEQLWKEAEDGKL